MTTPVDFWEQPATHAGRRVSRREAATLLREEGVPVAESAAAFAGGWEPDTYLAGPNRGKPCERHKASRRARPPQDGAGATGETVAADDTPTPAAAPATAVVAAKPLFPVPLAEVLRRESSAKWRHRSYDQAMSVLGDAKEHTRRPALDDIRRFAVELLRTDVVRNSLSDPRSRQAVDVATAVLEGRRPKDDLNAVLAQAHAATRHVGTCGPRVAMQAATMARNITDMPGEAQYQAAIWALGMMQTVAGGMSETYLRGRQAVNLDPDNDIRSYEEGVRLAEESVGRIARETIPNPYEPKPAVVADGDSRAMASELAASGDAHLARVLADHQEEHGCQAAADMLRRTADDLDAGLPMIRNHYVVARILGPA